MINRLLTKLQIRRTWLDRYPNVAANMLEVNNLENLKKAMGWATNPSLVGDHLYDFQYLEDLNERRLRDAEVLGACCCNGNPKILLEIGTSYGRTTALMAANARDGRVYTVNIPPEEIEAGGQKITHELSRLDIGRYYREQGMTNIEQIYENTATWAPEFGPIDVAFIDGCHDAEFVYMDTVKVLRQCRPGSIVLWHDFNPELSRVYHWLDDVSRGIERLYREGYLKGRILHLADSWVGLYKCSE